MKKILFFVGVLFLALSCDKFEEPMIIDLAKLPANFLARDGEVLTGMPNANIKITIADGATVTLRNVVIYGENDENCPWAGITAEGDATLVLEATNIVKGFYEEYPGIYVPEGKTLTIRGDGRLDACSNGYAAGIGAGYRNGRNCGNIRIEGGTIYAKGGKNAAAIGGADQTACGDISISGGDIMAANSREGAAGIGAGCREGSGCGNITISGGTVTAVGGKSSAGIGTGVCSRVGNITVTTGVKQVSARKGASDEYDAPAPHSIGGGLDYAGIGTVTIGGEVGPVSADQFVYKP